MRALVVFESMYGNTQTVAESIAEGLAAHLEVEVVEVGHAPRELGSDVELLVVGAPTHAFGLSRASTRASAAEQSGREVISSGEGVREWLDATSMPSGVAVATFDTHVDKRWVPGSAASVARRRLARAGGHVIAPAASFYVEDVEGPLLDGEAARARAWGEQLAEQVVKAEA